MIPRADLPPELPIGAVLPDILAALALRPNVVVVAPPGAGKTTRLPPALLAAPWAAGPGGGMIWLLSPRRLAARAAAERIAEELDEPVGGTVGYATRLERKLSAGTRLIVMTHGLFRNRLLADPELTGVAAVLFDEVHERSLDSDFALALALDSQQGLRPDLRLVAMSATLDGARFGAVMAGAPVVESRGASHDCAIRYLGRRAEQPLDQAVVAAARTALAADHGGDILVFLPGVRDIDRAAAALAAARLPLMVHLLHGQIAPEAQRAALRPDPGGARKLILATSIAETSLTIAGVRIVIDSGLARRPRFDRDAGLSRLVTERASQAAATQRAGRAARQGPGLVLRLWDAAATGGLIAFDPPEIHESDLMPVVLDCASLGIIDPRQLAWLDPPTPGAVAGAKAALADIGALGPDGRISASGADLARLPLPVPLAHMVRLAAGRGARAQTELAAMLAVLLTEPGLGGRSNDIEDRLRCWRSSRGSREEAAWRLARSLARMAGDLAADVPGGAGSDVRSASLSPGALVALAWPDRLARRRGGGAGPASYLSAGGRAFHLAEGDPLAASEWLAIGDAQGSAAGARIMAAAAITAAEVEALFTARIVDHQSSHYDAAADRVDHRRRRMLGAITLTTSATAGGGAAAGDCIAIRLDAVRAGGLGLIGWGPAASALRARAAFAGIAALAPAALLAGLDGWLAPLLPATRGLRDIADADLVRALFTSLAFADQQRLARLAPADYRTPAGSTLAIDYGAQAGPTVRVRVQEMFGLAAHPLIGDPPVPLVLALTSPAHRPIQTTRDLTGFWAGSWRDVQREMKGRYPKHPWPDDPVAAVATRLTKAAAARAQTP